MEKKPKLIEPPCKDGQKHEWQTFKQTVSVDNPLFAWGAAYFIVRGCPKCKKKLYTNYEVTKV